MVVPMGIFIVFLNVRQGQGTTHMLNTVPLEQFCLYYHSGPVQSTVVGGPRVPPGHVVLGLAVPPDAWS